MNVRKLLLFLILTTILVPSVSLGAKSDKKVYLIVVNRLTLKDIETMGKLKNVIKEGSIGLKNTRGTSGYTGAESFLTINSSGKAYANYASIKFETIENGNIINRSFTKLINLNKDNKYTPYLGAIGDNLHRKGLKTAIYGNSNLEDMEINTSALIPMDSKGLIDYGNIDDIIVETLDYPFFIKTDYNKMLEEIKESPGDFIVVETGDIERLYRYKDKDNLSYEEFKDIREKILLDIDNFIEELIKELNKKSSLVMITSPNSGDMKIDSNSKLAPIILWGNEVENGALISKTTGRESVVANIDIGPTIMDFLGASKDGMSGTGIKSIKKDINLIDIVKQSNSINTTFRVRYNTLYYYGLFSMVSLILGIILVLAKVKLSGKVKEYTRILFDMVILLPIIFIFVSIFKPENNYSFILLLLFFIFIFIFILWLTRKSNNQIMYIGGAYVFIIILDLALKGGISKYSVLSHDPIIGARYYGIGNEMVGLFLGTIIIFSANILKKYKRKIVPLILLALAIILVGHPKYGANIGGSMAFIVSAFFYIMELFNKELNIKGLIIPIFLIVVLISIMGYIDIKFNPDTTHLGNTLLTIKNNELHYLDRVMLRKALMNIKLIGSSFWTYLLLVHMVLHGVIFNRNTENAISSMARAAGIAGVIGGFLLNDSGLILAAICMNLISSELYLDYIE
ncbi:hypothetical protein RBU61_09890 [Tissierella sp. MB52-C2]|uniref:hypothetical protein n=1 Tax=Tissierella sp. MB52-C2 TaxID=3070999 RepID=UPI00280B4E59|nr:hypothetical protein [Tissierella sp. MB52-C2]WMM23267.1 hypothetical protein RBU61_09890 [Tissierella sp. MB52-C2]